MEEGRREGGREEEIQLILYSKLIVQPPSQSQHILSLKIIDGEAVYSTKIRKCYKSELSFSGELLSSHHWTHSRSFRVVTSGKWVYQEREA